jgi:hypothetical protein
MTKTIKLSKKAITEASLNSCINGVYALRVMKGNTAKAEIRWIYHDQSNIFQGFQGDNDDECFWIDIPEVDPYGSGALCEAANELAEELGISIPEDKSASGYLKDNFADEYKDMIDRMVDHCIWQLEDEMRTYAHCEVEWID